MAMDMMDKAKNFVVEKVTNIKKPEASITDVDLKDVALDSITYMAKVSVNNPYGAPIPICQISYTLKSAGRVIASGTVPDQGSLKGNDITILDVPVKVPHSVLVSLGKDVGADWKIDYELEMGLTIDLPVVRNITIPVTSKGQIKLPTLTDMFN